MPFWCAELREPRTALGQGHERSQILSFNREWNLSLFRRADDGLDGPALPVFPSHLVAAGAALHRDVGGPRGPAWRARPPAALRRGGARRRPSTRRLRSGGIGGGGAHWRRLRF